MDRTTPRRWLSKLWALSFFAARLAAGAEPGQPADQAAHELLQTMDDLTEIATKTRLNADYVPGQVTVLSGPELEELGIESVWEALETVPGIEIEIDIGGIRQVVIRGVGRTFASGTIKYLLDGVPLNSALLGLAYPVLEMPIALIERIEVIRGPGSAVHGEYAFAGVINVVTRRGGNRVFARTGSFATQEAGALVSWRSESSDTERGVHLDLILAAGRTDGADVLSGPDALFALGQGALSYAPGPANEDRDHRTMNLTLGYRGFTVLAQILEEGHGDHLGTGGTLPPPEDRIVIRHDTKAVEARQRLGRGESWRADVRLGWLVYRFDVDDQVLYPPGGLYPDGVIFAPHYEESKLYGGADLTRKLGGRHTLLVAAAIGKIRVDEVWLETNFVPTTGQPLPSIQRFEGDESQLDPHAERTQMTLGFQDELDVGPRLRLTAGLRYDRYDDAGENLSPRLAAVWRPSDRHLFKVQASGAFRPPTFLELHSRNNPVINGNPDVEPETKEAFEVGHVFKCSRCTIRTTFFHSENDDLIVVRDKRYDNTGDVRITGLETELERHLGRSWLLDAEITALVIKDVRTRAPLEGVASVTAGLSVAYRPNERWSFAGRFRHVGPRQRDPADSREDLRGYERLDLSVNLYDRPFAGLTLRAGIKNVLDQDIRYPAPLGTYPEDYPRPGRQWWAQISYDF